MLAPLPPPWERRGDLLCDFEDPQQPECPQNTDPKGGSWLDGSPHHFEDAPHDDLQRRWVQPRLTHARLCAAVPACLWLPLSAGTRRLPRLQPKPHRALQGARLTQLLQPPGAAESPPVLLPALPAPLPGCARGHGTERGQACGFLMDGKPTYLAPPRPAPHHSLTASRLLTSRRQAARYRQPGPPAVPTGQRSPLPRTPEPWCGLRPDTFGFTS